MYSHEEYIGSGVYGHKFESLDTLKRYPGDKKLLILLKVQYKIW